MTPEAPLCQWKVSGKTEIMKFSSASNPKALLFCLSFGTIRLNSTLRSDLQPSEKVSTPQIDKARKRADPPVAS
jgi:hypothetical protein